MEKEKIEPLIRAEDIKRFFATPKGRLDILKGLSLSIKPSETLSIMGPSGSGKSTLLAMLAGLDLPSEGSVFYKDLRLSALNEDERAAWRAGRVGFIFQSFVLIDHLTVLENVMLPMELWAQRNAKDKALELLRKVGLEDRRSQTPRQLSGGEQQRVGIARAFSTDPEILFADEPTGSLDPESAEIAQNLLFQMNEKHATTLILVTHDVGLAMRCGRQLVLKEGMLFEQGGPA